MFVVVAVFVHLLFGFFDCYFTYFITIFYVCAHRAPIICLCLFELLLLLRAADVAVVAFLTKTNCTF